MKNFILVTGGAGFVGANLIELLLKKTNKKILSLDNYSTGTKKNHIKSTRVTYLTGNTININKIFNKYKKKFTLHFILVSFQGFIKVLKNLINVTTLTQ